MQTFYLKWSTEHGLKITSYIYDGLGNQAGFDLEQWKQRCISFGLSEGRSRRIYFKGEATAEEWLAN